MKRIILCVVLAIICLVVGAFSFLINDLPSYHRWMSDNGPRIKENFNARSKDKGKEEFRSSPSEDDRMPHRDNRQDTMRNGGPMDGSHRGPMMGSPNNSRDTDQQASPVPSDK